MTNQFESKVAPVTGENSGLGRAIALAFAREGAKVVVAARRAPESEELEAHIIAMHPIGRLGQPEEVTSATLWLCSDNASFVTGIAHPVDGGYLL